MYRIHPSRVSNAEWLDDPPPLGTGLVGLAVGIAARRLPRLVLRGPCVRQRTDGLAARSAHSKLLFALAKENCDVAQHERLEALYLGRRKADLVFAEDRTARPCRQQRGECRLNDTACTRWQACCSETAPMGWACCPSRGGDCSEISP